MNYQQIYNSFYTAGKVAAMNKLAGPPDRAARIRAAFPTLNAEQQQGLIDNQAFTDEHLNNIEANARARSSQTRHPNAPTPVQQLSPNEEIKQNLKNWRRPAEAPPSVPSAPGEDWVKRINRFTNKYIGGAANYAQKTIGSKAVEDAGVRAANRASDVMQNPENYVPRYEKTERGDEQIVIPGYSGKKSPSALGNPAIAQRVNSFSNGLSDVMQNPGSYLPQYVKTESGDEQIAIPAFASKKSKPVTTPRASQLTMQNAPPYSKPGRTPGASQFPMRDASPYAMPVPGGFDIMGNTPAPEQLNMLKAQGLPQPQRGQAPAQAPAPAGRNMMDRLLLRHPNTQQPNIPTFGSGPTSQAAPPRRKSTLADMQRLSARLTNRAPNRNSMPLNESLRGVLGGNSQGLPSALGNSQGLPTALNMRQISSPNSYRRNG